MAETTILLNGFSILNDASISVDANGGYQNEGGLNVSGGDMLFEPDDIILMEVIDAGPNGEVDSSSAITRIIVYDNATDYYNDVQKFVYEGNNASQTGSIRSNNSGVGDNYLRINSNVLQSNDPNAPDLGQLFVAAGYDLSDVADGDTLFIDQFQDNDFNANDGIDGNTSEEADGVFVGGDAGNNTLVVLCFAKGTRIDTPMGPRPVETLEVGDPVSTLDNGAQSIRWIGQRTCNGIGALAPIQIKAQTLGNLRDLWVSPNHRLLISGMQAELMFGQSEVLVAAKHLVNDDTIRQHPVDEVEYFHILFDAHQIIFAEGCPAESLFPGQEALSTVDPEEHAEIIALFPDLARDSTAHRLSRYTLRAHEADALRVA
ncbi:MAG: Hint domain-containing protein [Tateyamaria sp.]